VELLTGFGLATAAGLNAYIPLLAIGLLGRFTDLITLPDNWKWMENGWTLAILAVLLAPVVHRFLHRFHLVPRFLTVAGLASVAVLLVGSLFDLFGADLDMLVYGAPMGAIELLLGVWLLVRPTPLLGVGWSGDHSRVPSTGPRRA